jgi:hypothetical protein
VKVTVIGPENADATTARICENGNTTIEFLTEFGDLPLFTLNMTDMDQTTLDWANGYVLNITEVRAGEYPERCV